MTLGSIWESTTSLCMDYKKQPQNATNFNSHMLDLIRKASKKINALARVTPYINI